jgi:hypothetical protein
MYGTVIKALLLLGVASFLGARLLLRVCTSGAVGRFVRQWMHGRLARSSGDRAKSPSWVVLPLLLIKELTEIF